MKRQKSNCLTVSCACLSFNKNCNYIKMTEYLQTLLYFICYFIFAITNYKRTHLVSQFPFLMCHIRLPFRIEIKHWPLIITFLWNFKQIPEEKSMGVNFWFIVVYFKDFWVSYSLLLYFFHCVNFGMRSSYSKYIVCTVLP